MSKWVALALFCVVSVQTLSAQYIHPKFKSGEKVIRNFAVLAPEIDVAGKPADASSAKPVATMLEEIITAALKNAGREALPAPGDETILAAVRKRFGYINKLMETSPKEIAKVAYTLGSGVGDMIPPAKINALVFIRADAEPDRLHAHFTLVDTDTGDVFYYIAADAKGDAAAQRAAIERGVAAGMKNFPK